MIGRMYYFICDTFSGGTRRISRWAPSLQWAMNDIKRDPEFNEDDDLIHDSLRECAKPRRKGA